MRTLNPTIARDNALIDELNHWGKLGWKCIDYGNLILMRVKRTDDE